MGNEILLGVGILIPTIAMVIYGVLKKLRVVKCGCCEMETRTPRTPRPEDVENQNRIFSEMQTMIKEMQAANAAANAPPQSLVEPHLTEEI